MLTTYDVIVVGAGIFGITAAIELRRRHHSVAIFDPGPLPHPLAASTDISKVVRIDYGSDETYMVMAEAALSGWKQWNDQFSEPLYHNTGLTMITREPMSPGTFTADSYDLLQQRNHHPERLNSDDILRRFPAWKPGAFVDGYYLDAGGYAESGLVVAELVQQAIDAGITIYTGQQVAEVEKVGGRVAGVRTVDGHVFNAGQVLISAGVWTPLLLPELSGLMSATGHPIFHLKTADTTLFRPPHFTVFTADVANSGWYGYPLHPKQKVIKIVNHSEGPPSHPSRDKREVTDVNIRHLRRFLEDAFPTLREATITYTRRCLYNKTEDGDFLIDQHPGIPGLFVAAGGSGHGFKFAPIMGPLIADAIDGNHNPWLGKFRWRQGNHPAG